MKTRMGRTLKEVWAMKRAVQEETKHLKGVAYFEYVHAQVRRQWSHRAKLRYLSYPDAATDRLAAGVAEERAYYGPPRPPRER